MIDLDPASDWPSAIETAPVGATVRFRPGLYVLERTARLADLRDVRIVGSGPRTVVYLPSSLMIGFELVGGLRGVSIESLTLIGGLSSHDQVDAARGNEPVPESTVRNTHAIGAWSNAGEIEGLVLADLTIHNVAVGIGLAGEISGAAVLGCQITDCFGTESGRGYGVVASTTNRLIVSNNDIQRCGRHGIYLGHGDGPAWVEGNTITDHRQGLEPGPYWRPALVVARTSHVVVRGNEIVRSADVGLSVERDDQNPERRIEEVRLIGNRFDRNANPSGVPDVWINTGEESGPVELLDNDFGNRDPAEAVRIDSGVIS